MKTIILCLIIGLLGCKIESNKQAEPTAELPLPVVDQIPTPTPELTPQIVNSDLIDVISSQSRPDYPIENTIDKNTNLMWTTYELSLDESHYVSYLLPERMHITSLLLFNNYSNTYTYGDLAVYVSTDSTNGVNGSWSKVFETDATSALFLDGDGELPINAEALWVKLNFTYTGTGAYGGSPSFYISEIQFLGY